MVADARVRSHRRAYAAPLAKTIAGVNIPARNRVAFLLPNDSEPRRVFPDEFVCEVE